MGTAHLTECCEAVALRAESTPPAAFIHPPTHTHTHTCMSRTPSAGGLQHSAPHCLATRLHAACSRHGYPYPPMPTPIHIPAMGHSLAMKSLTDALLQQPLAPWWGVARRPAAARRCHRPATRLLPHLYACMDAATPRAHAMPVASQSSQQQLLLMCGTRFVWGLSRFLT